MREAELKKLTAVLSIITLVSFLWAVGAHSRKQVELEKSGSLDKQVEKFTQTNIVLMEDLKKTQNELAETKRALHSLRETMAAEEPKMQALRARMEETQKQNERFAAEIETLRRTHQTLNAELTQLKEQYAAVKKEAAAAAESNPAEKPDAPRGAESSRKSPERINWNW